MKKIKIFLASSIREFEKERIAIGDIVRQIQNRIIDDGIRLDLFMCEFADNSMSNGRMQERYNDELRKSDIFIMLIGKKAGEFTIEEYEVSKEVNKIKRYILFQDIESDNSVKDFKEILKNDYNTGINHIIYNFKNEKELLNSIQEIISNVLGDVK